MRWECEREWARSKGMIVVLFCDLVGENVACDVMVVAHDGIWVCREKVTMFE